MYAKYWLLDSNFVERMKRVNTSSWKVINIINDRFFVVEGWTILNQINKAGYTGAGVEPIGKTKIEMIQYINSMFK